MTDHTQELYERCRARVLAQRRDRNRRPERGPSIFSLK